MKTFAITGVSGYVAPRHLSAIAAVGGFAVAALDPHDAAGVLDKHNLSCEFFTEFESFERYMERRHLEGRPVDYLTVCAPNYLHDCHVRLGLRTGCTVICEKPLVITPHNLDALADAERKYGQHVFTILQLRHHPKLVEMKARFDAAPAVAWRPREASITYVTERGPWYDRSWKGSEEKSGGVAMNIGVHLFDLMCWFFGTPESVRLYKKTPRSVEGTIRFITARVRFLLSVDASDLRDASQTSRSIDVDGEKITFDEGFGDLHTAAYQHILAGNGFGIGDARPAIELIEKIRHTTIVP